MDIKDQWQVCSLELSKRLKELGYPQKSLWYWVNDGKALNEGKDRWILVYKYWTNYKSLSRPDKVSAPSVAEIGMALPNNLKDKNGKFLWLTSAMRSDRIWFIWYDNTLKKDIVNGIFYYRQTADTEAEARGLMWEYLKKNGLIKEKNEKTERE